MDISAERSDSIRPFEVISFDLKNADQALALLDTEFRLWFDAYSALPSDKHVAFTALLDEFSASGLSEELMSNIPDDLSQLLREYASLSLRIYQLQVRRESLQRELIPYIREEFREASDHLSLMVNFDNVFAYYREIYLGLRKPMNDDDCLITTATELYILRKYQYDIRYNAESFDYDYFVAGLQLIKKYEETWRTKGFLLDSPRDRSDLCSVFGDQVGKERQSIVEKVTFAIEQLHEYGRLCRIYKPATVNHCVTGDFALEELAFVLGAGDATMHHLYYQSNFDHIDFDPEFVAAAGRHIEQVLVEHRKAGRISRNSADLDAEKERIDSLSAADFFDAIQFEGFSPPEGMIAVVTPEEILAELQATVPLDFLMHLRSVEYTSGSHLGEALNTGSEDVRTAGSFIPELVNGVFDHARIEVYFPFFVPAGTDYYQSSFNVSTFMGTLFHEIGHNAHYACDYDEMKAWEQVIQADPISVGWYVARSRSINESLGQREDFAETLRLYLQYPALLKVLSLSRYDYMCSFFYRHLQTRQQDGFTQRMNLKILWQESLWRACGLSKDDIIRLFSSSYF